MLYLILFLVLFATLSCSKEPPPTSSSDEVVSDEVVIPDANLRTYIRKKPKYTTVKWVDVVGCV